MICLCYWFVTCFISRQVLFICCYCLTKKKNNHKSITTDWRTNEQILSNHVYILTLRTAVFAGGAFYVRWLLCVRVRNVVQECFTRCDDSLFSSKVLMWIGNIYQHSDTRAEGLNLYIILFLFSISPFVAQSELVFLQKEKLHLHYIINLIVVFL